MSTKQIARSADLQKLRETGHNIQITDGNYLAVRDVPYVNSHGKVAYDGILVSNLDLAGDITVRPEDHTAKFAGEYPCDSNGKALDILKHQSGEFSVGSGIIAQHS